MHQGQLGDLEASVVEVRRPAGGWSAVGGFAASRQSDVGAERSVLGGKTVFPQFVGELEVQRGECREVTREVDPQHAGRPRAAEVARGPQSQRASLAAGRRLRADGLERVQALLGLLAEKREGEVQQGGVDPAIVAVLAVTSHASKDRLNLGGHFDGEEQPHWLVTQHPGLGGRSFKGQSPWTPGGGGSATSPYGRGRAKRG